MNKKIISLPLLLASPLLLTSAAQKQLNRPNVLIILLDDAGYNDFGFMGSKDLKSPNIDELASQSTLLTNAHVTASVSGPSRAGLLTGRYQQRFGAECNFDDTSGLALNEKTIADIFKSNGYKTSCIGKWHMGNGSEYHPNKRGFDHFFGFLAGARSYFYDEKTADKPGNYQNLQLNGVQQKFDGYLTDVLSNEAIRFIQQTNDPFMMYLSYNAVHTPMEATKADMELFKGHPRQTLAAMTWAVDRAIGSVINTLKSKGIYENTLIFFLSDNGGPYENKSSNFPLKGVKGTKYEGGIRIPFFVKWGNRFENRTFDGLSSSLDIFATSLDAAGINYKHVSPKLDGVSLVPYLQNKKSGNPHQYLFFRKDKFSAVIYNNYKVVTINGVDDRMYNLDDSLKETEDLKYSEPKVYRKIIKAYKNWGKEMKTPLWLEPENWNKVVYLMHDDMLNNRPIKVYNPSQLNKTNRISNLPSKEKVLEFVSRVNNKWQAENDVTKQSSFWHPATYHIGNLAAYRLTKNENYLDYTLRWAEKNQWSGAKSNKPEEWKFSYGEKDEYVLFGDWQACFQVYIDLYHMNPEKHKIARAKEVMAYQVSTNENKYWWWIDGLFMVMPVMTRMYELTQDEIYLEKLNEYYSYTLKEVYDDETGLLFRDAKYIYPKHKTNSGKKDFWSRGNGWVFAALALTLDKLPKTDAHYPEYVEVFKKMAYTLKNTQQVEGYWTRSILDPQQAPGAETSGTAFFTFGMLWGMNNGILNEETFSPVAKKGWKYLAETAVQNDGTLGYVQPIGEKAIPGQIIDVHSTADFGVGAFLLAGAEMLKFIENQNH